MMLHFSNLAKLKTKRIIFEEIYVAADPSTLEELKELSARRRAIEESINETSVTAKAIAREMAAGLTSRLEQDLRKLELYLPLLENLVFHVASSGDGGPGVELKISWSSAFSPFTLLNLGGCKFFHNDELCFELGMALFLYGAILRERAQEVLSTGDLVQSSTLYRKAAGVYHHLFQRVLPRMKSAVGQERPPPEATPSLSYVMSLICLAEAQGAALRKAVENGTSVGLLSKLDYGIKELLVQANSILNSSNGKSKIISTKLEEFIYFSRSLHELRSKRYLADSLKNDHIGLAIGVLRGALENIKGRTPREESWQLVFKQETKTVGEMLRKLEHENSFVFHERVPVDVDLLPSSESKKIVTEIPYNPRRSETKLVLRFENKISSLAKPHFRISRTM
ncbi:hypothetical protein MKX01_019166 [Papaver californicum]|nr:hypothetical protein MKX01_019166 [Papaver californicum]